jgi:glutamine synthetase
VEAGDQSGLPEGQLLPGCQRPGKVRKTDNPGGHHGVIQPAEEKLGGVLKSLPRQMSFTDVGCNSRKRIYRLKGPQAKFKIELWAS